MTPLLLLDKFMKLEDVVSKFHKPCIMDVKLGRRVWDDYANSDKIDKEKRKYPLQEVIGFRVTGMRVSRSLGSATCWSKCEMK